jgi:hypothetical protein
MPLLDYGTKCPQCGKGPMGNAPAALREEMGEKRYCWVCQQYFMPDVSSNGADAPKAKGRPWKLNKI